MAYCELPQLIGYLDQLDGDTDKEPVLQAVIDRAAALINIDLGVDADLTPAVPGTQVVYGDGTRYLVPRGPWSAVTLVEAPGGYTVPDYRTDDSAIITHSSTVYFDAYYHPSFAVWQPVAYTVHATFGFSGQVMTALEQANLEIAVNLWRFKDSGGSQQVGAETGVINVRQQFSPMVRDLLAIVKRAINGNNPGVW